MIEWKCRWENCILPSSIVITVSMCQIYLVWKLIWLNRCRNWMELYTCICCIMYMYQIDNMVLSKQRLTCFFCSTCTMFKVVSKEWPSPQAAIRPQRPLQRTTASRPDSESPVASLILMRMFKNLLIYKGIVFLLKASWKLKSATSILFSVSP